MDKYLKNLKILKDFDKPESVINFYAKAKQTTKRLAKLFYSDPKSEEDRASYRFFMRYIRSLEHFESTKLLRFFTGSDIIIIENIEVSFRAMEGLQDDQLPIHGRQCWSCQTHTKTSRRVYKYIECWEY